MSTCEQTDTDIAILGGGIAGLSLGYHLQKHGCESYALFESAPQTGGLARSFRWHGFDCDIAPHRLFSENQEILTELLQLVDCNLIQRNSKIILNGKAINDPISIFELLWVNLPFRSIALVFSYLRARITPGTCHKNFDCFIKSHYGQALNTLFFKPYAEKLLGLESRQISAEWGARKVRVSGLKELFKKNTKLYFKHFYYPKVGGYGAFAAQLTMQTRAHIHTRHQLEKISYDAQKKIYTCNIRNEQGDLIQHKSTQLVSTLPLNTLLKLLGHSINLNYRKVRLVYLYLSREKIMDQQWAYFIDRGTLINRLSELKNFYPKLSHTNTTVLCSEITTHPDCSAETVIQELQEMGLLKASEVLDSKVIDIPYAYPVFDLQYEAVMTQANDILKQYPGLQRLGRQAEFIHQDIDEIFESAKHTAARCMAAAE